LDALAAHGLLFPEAICTHTQSGPSKYSLLSGRLPYPVDSIDPAAWPLLPAQLRAAGYTTAAVGHLELDAPLSGLGLDVVRQTGEKARSAGRDDYVTWLATQGITEPTADRPVAALTRAFGVAPSGLRQTGM